MRDYPECARALDKYRINPGNVGMGRQHDDNFRAIIDIAIEHGKAVRIGVNWGSLDQSLVTRLMDENARTAVSEGRQRSCDGCHGPQRAGVGGDGTRLRLGGGPHHPERQGFRSSGSDRCLPRLAGQSRYALHLGLTEAGMGRRGIVSSTAALAVLLQEGIGDTIRVSLTPAPGGDRTEEVRTCQDVLQSLGIRSFSPQVTACPGCGRTTSTVFQEMAGDIQNYIWRADGGWKQIYPGIESLKVAVMGCIVNGPGESKHADIGISLPGTGEEPKAPVYVDGRLMTTLKGPSIVADFMAILDDYVERAVPDALARKDDHYTVRKISTSTASFRNNSTAPHSI